MRPSGRSQWLDLLCTTRTERNHPAFEGFEGHGGLVEVAAAAFTHFPGESLAGLELAWELDPEHVGFETLSESQSAEGAVVREFLMRKAIGQGAVKEPATATAAPAAARARRAQV